MSAAWYYAKNKERFGPASLAELRSLVAQGQPADPGRTIVINHPPVQRWSPGLAAVLLHLFCIIGAASGNPWPEGETTVVRE